MTQLIAHPGTNPTITLPVVRGVAPDCEDIWRHLAEPADYFGVPMPEPAELHGAILAYLDGAGARSTSGMLTLVVTLYEVGGLVTVAVRGEPAQPIHPVAVRIATLDAPVAGFEPTEARWRQMAARTTSHGGADALARWLAGRGCVDGVPAQAEGGAPYLGALVFDTPAGLLGIERPWPTSILGRLVDCGLAVPVVRTDDRPTRATAAWWVSPGFETHPVAGIGGHDYVVVAVPPFLEVA